ncbi:MAG: cupredoxin domain-containing protein [DPANN group archaeon]|nr:cupredoxin domain-containing protein [DPANN group archaeon]
MAKLSIALILITVIALSGCVGGTTEKSASDGSVKIIPLAIAHTGYSPSTITVNKGDYVKIQAVAAVGTSTHAHGVTIDEYGINKKVTTEDPASPEVIEFLADKAGTFKIYCGTCKEGIFGAEHPKIEAKLVVK